MALSDKDQDQFVAIMNALTKDRKLPTHSSWVYGGIVGNDR